MALAGCRTYGDYNSEAKVYAQAKQAVEEFSEVLDRAEEDLRLLKKAASERDTLQSVALRYHDLVEEHRLLLEDQKQRLAALSPDARYRALSRTYRAIVKEQSLLRRHYQRLIRAVQSTGQETEAAPARHWLQDRSRYFVTPLGFPRGQQRDTLSMEQALQSL